MKSRDSSIQELTSKVESLEKDMQYEKKKNSKVVKENQTLRKELAEIEEKVSGDNDPAKMKRRLGDLRSKLAEATR